MFIHLLFDMKVGLVFTFSNCCWGCLSVFIAKAICIASCTSPVKVLRFNLWFLQLWLWHFISQKPTIVLIVNFMRKDIQVCGSGWIVIVQGIVLSLRASAVFVGFGSFGLGIIGIIFWRFRECGRGFRSLIGLNSTHH